MREYIVSTDKEYEFEMGRFEELQELIRCKDCVFWKNYCRVVDGVRSDHVCSKKRELDGTMYRTKADDFCSQAERKEE